MSWTWMHLKLREYIMIEIDVGKALRLILQEAQGKI